MMMFPASEAKPKPCARPYHHYDDYEVNMMISVMMMNKTQQTICLAKVAIL